MKVVCLVSGLLRTFSEHLFPFLCELANYVDLHMYLTLSDESQDTKFQGNNQSAQLEPIRSHPICKGLLVHQPSFANHLPISQREKNTIYQWYNLYQCFLQAEQSIEHPTTIVIRIRPDIVMDCSVEEFVSILTHAQSFSGILIPTGSDIFSKEYFAFTNACINDQMAIGSYTIMKEICSLFLTLDLDTIESPIISETLLFTHCIDHRIPVKRVSVPYHLCLSACKMVAITGDSGVGKSTFVEALRDCVPFDSNLVLETDRYHKWERGHEQWSTITHLHPEANFLERMNDDTYQLKMGHQIQQVDYDHSTGRFTSPETIDSKPFMFLCGLHTLYKRELRAWCDIKVYIDTTLTLKRLWKIQRDMKKRGYSFEKCLTIFNKRQEDYQTFIAPQMAHADCVIRYSTPTPIPDVFGIESIPITLECICELTNEFLPCVESFLIQVSSRSWKVGHRTAFQLRSDLTQSQLITYVDSSYHPFIRHETLRESYQGIFQLLFIQLMFDSSTQGSHAV
jgi:uridine kinase